jgi:spore coat polysaccharide biosynthesis protein SpsF
MRVGVIIQARLSSSRLPGKVLAPVAGRPLLQLLVERLERSRLAQGLVVATSDQPSDDPVAQLCATLGLACVRGPLDDVAERFRLALEQAGWEAFVRVSGDSPLLDPRLVDQALTIFQDRRPDLVTNVAVRSFPKGQSVEVVEAGAFCRACAGMETAHDREHVTPFIYRRSREFDIVNFVCPRALGDMQMSVDTPEDLARCRSVVEGMARPHWDYGWDELANMFGQATGAEGERWVA